MTTSEFGAAARIAAGAVGDGVRRIQGTHAAIARRAWGPTGPGGQPSKVVHDIVADGAYGSVRMAFGAAGGLVGAALDGAAVAGGWKPLSQSVGGGAALGVLNGFAGDRLAEQGSELALPMRVRHGGNDVVLTVDDLADAFPDAAGHVVVFLHGLIENDRSWWWGDRRYCDDPRVSYGSRRRADVGATPQQLLRWLREG